MIKILFIHSKLVCGGAEQALFDLVSLLDKSKFEITVMVQYDGGIWEQKFRDAGIRVVSIWDGQKSSHNPLTKLQNLHKRKLITKALERDGEGLLKACRHDNFDIIVSYSGSTLQKMCFSENAKTVKYIHGDMESNPKFCDNIVTTLDLVSRFDRIICVSETARHSFEEITGITEGVSAHFNPLNSDNVRALAQEKAPIPDDLPVICAVGRLSEEKGFDRLIRIHKKIWNAGMLHRLVIVGDGPERIRLEETIQELQAEDSVILAGYTSNPYPYIRQSQFLVCSSYTEGLPVVAMEALSLGIPVVSAVPSIGELFGDILCGLVTENDDESLATGIRRMLEPDYYAQAKVGAVRRSAFFDGRKMVREVEREFEELVCCKNDGK